MWRTPWHRWHAIVPVHGDNPDHWLNVVLGLAAVLTILGVVIGGLFGLLYGRRASVSLKATVAESQVGYVIVARPSVKAVGVIRVRFLGGIAGSQVTATEMFTDTAGKPMEARTYPVRNLFGEAFVDGGEELVTTTLIAVPRPPASVFGWAVWVEVRAPGRFLGRKWIRDTGHWLLRRWPVSFLRRNAPKPIPTLSKEAV